MIRLITRPRIRMITRLIVGAASRADNDADNEANN